MKQTATGRNNAVITDSKHVQDVVTERLRKNMENQETVRHWIEI